MITTFPTNMAKMQAADQKQISATYVIDQRPHRELRKAPYIRLKKECVKANQSGGNANGKSTEERKRERCPTSLVTKKMQIKTLCIHLVSTNFGNLSLTCIGKNSGKQALNMFMLL